MRKNAETKTLCLFMHFQQIAFPGPWPKRASSLYLHEEGHAESQQKRKHHKRGMRDSLSFREECVFTPVSFSIA